jgi:hypothetical protein
VGKKKFSARCMKCGKVFLLGVNGVMSDSGGDLCDPCSQTTRDASGHIVQTEGERWQARYNPKTAKRRR